MTVVLASSEGSSIVRATADPAAGGELAASVPGVVTCTCLDAERDALVLGLKDGTIRTCTGLSQPGSFSSPGFPLVFTLFLFLFSTHLPGMIPYSFTATSPFKCLFC